MRSVEPQRRNCFIPIFSGGSATERKFLNRNVRNERNGGATERKVNFNEMPSSATLSAVNLFSARSASSAVKPSSSCS